MSNYKKCFLIIGLWWGTYLFASAPDTAWTRRFDETVGTAIRQTQDGGYIISSVGYELLKTDSLGNKEWLKVTGFYGQNHSIWQTQDGGYVVTGGGLFSTGYQDSSILLLKTDAQGDVEWYKTFEENSYGGGQCAQQTQDGGYIITGDKDKGDYLVLIKTDSAGNKEWEKSFSRTISNVGYWVQQTQDGGYVIVGIISDFDSTLVWLIKTDSLGNTEWDKTFGGGSAWCVQQTQDKGFIILTGYRLIKTDSLGNKEWDKIFSSGGRGLSVRQVADGGYFIVGEWSSARGILVIRTDASGDTLWTKILSRGLNWDIGYSGQPTSDGGYIIVGETGEKPGNYPINLKTWLIKLKSETGVEEGYRMQDTEYGLAVIPNPSGNKASINYIVQNTGNRTQDVSLQVYDMAGRIVETLVSEKKEDGRYNIDFHGRRGIYFVELIVGNYKETKKLILLF